MRGAVGIRSRKTYFMWRGEGRTAMNDLISRQAIQDDMYHEAFETDSDMQKWDSGCWIRYKMFENVLAQQKSLKYTGNSICLYCKTVNCDGCMYEPMEGVQ